MRIGKVLASELQLSAKQTLTTWVLTTWAMELQLGSMKKHGIAYPWIGVS